MRHGLATVLLLLVLPLAGCGADEDEWEGPPAPGNGGNLSVREFNHYLAAHGETASSPVIAATRFLRLDGQATTRTSILTEPTAEGSDPVTVTVTLDRLLDDSVRAKRYVLVFVREGEGWKLGSATTAQRCWPNRGHRTFSPEPCV
jgi:hypothetical protein